MGGNAIEAMSLRDRAVTLVRELYERDSKRYCDELATNLHCWGETLVHCRRSKKAAESFGEAVTLRRQLYAQGPEQHNTALASSLQKYRISLRSTGWKKALNLSMTLFSNHKRDLKRRRIPDELALSLREYGLRLYDDRRIDEACVADKEAVALHRQLFAMDPDAHRGALATSLQESATILHAADRFWEALQISEEAITLGRQLFKQDPERHKANLARHLYNYGMILLSE